MILREVRGPHCDRLQFRLMGEVQWLERKCRCKSTFVIQGSEVLIVTGAATVTATFGGQRYTGFSIPVH